MHVRRGLWIWISIRYGFNTVWLHMTFSNSRAGKKQEKFVSDRLLTEICCCRCCSSYNFFEQFDIQRVKRIPQRSSLCGFYPVIFQQTSSGDRGGERVRESEREREQWKIKYSQKDEDTLKKPHNYKCNTFTQKYMDTSTFNMHKECDTMRCDTKKNTPFKYNLIYVHCLESEAIQYAC